MTDSVTEVYFSAKRVKKLERDLGELREERLFKLDGEGQARIHHTDKKKRVFQAVETAGINNYSRCVSPPPSKVNLPFF